MGKGVPRRAEILCHLLSIFFIIGNYQTHQYGSMLRSWVQWRTVRSYESLRRTRFTEMGLLQVQKYITPPECSRFGTSGIYQLSQEIKLRDSIPFVGRAP